MLQVVCGLLCAGSSSALAKIIAGLAQHQLGTLVRFTVQWNTRTSTCTIAQVWSDEIGLPQLLEARNLRVILRQRKYRFINLKMSIEITLF